MRPKRIDGLARSLLAVLLVGAACAIPDAAASPTPPRPELWVMDADGTGQRMLAGPNEGFFDYSEGAWSPDSTRLVASGRGLLVIDVTSGRITELTSGRGPDWAPSGEEIVFSDHVSTPPGHNENLYVIDAGGAGRRLLVDTQQLDASPSWSPDGSQVAFVSGPGHGMAGQVFVVARDGTRLRQISTGGALYVAPVWSPDGNRIAFEAFDHRLHVIHLDGGAEAEVVDFNYSGQATWCSDGTLYFVGHPGPDGPHGIYRMDRSGNVGFLTNGVAPDCAPSGRLAFSREGDIHITDPGKAGTPNLTASADSSEMSAGWSPDGSRLAFVSTPHLPDPIVVERTLRLALRKHLVASGRLVFGDPQCQLPVKLQRLRERGWKTIERIYPDDDGRFRVRFGDHPGFYRAVAPHAFSLSGERECLRAESDIVRHRH